MEARITLPGILEHSFQCFHRPPLIDYLARAVSAGILRAVEIVIPCAFVESPRESRLATSSFQANWRTLDEPLEGPPFYGSWKATVSDDLRDLGRVSTNPSLGSLTTPTSPPVPVPPKSILTPTSGIPSCPIKAVPSPHSSPHAPQFAQPKPGQL